MSQPGCRWHEWSVPLFSTPQLSPLACWGGIVYKLIGYSILPKPCRLQAAENTTSGEPVAPESTVADAVRGAAGHAKLSEFRQRASKPCRLQDEDDATFWEPIKLQRAVADAIGV